MALVLADRVRDTTTTTGTGTVTLSGTAPTGYQNFSVVGNGNTTYYTINAGSQWEVGIGTYSSTGPTLSRDTVLSSSSSGSLVNFSAGTKDVFLTYPSGKSVYQDNSTIKAGSAVLAVPNGGTGASTLTSGYLLKGNGTSAVSASVVYDNGTNVGIGTASPSYALSVVDDGSYTKAGANSFSSVIYMNKGRGSVASPTNISSGDNLGAIWFNGYSGSGNNGGYGYGAYIGGQADGPVYVGTVPGRLVFATTSSGTSSPTERMRIDSSGNVGIGTTSPSYKLDVVGGVSATSGSNQVVLTTDGSIEVIRATGDAYIDLKNSSGEDYDCRIQSAGTTTPALTFSVNAAERMRITDTGNVGIGTASPGSVLQLNKASGSVDLRLSVGGTLYTNFYASASDTSLYSVQALPLILGTNNTERMRIDSSGNVGIGTSSPSYKLDVFGTSSTTMRSYSTGTAASTYAAVHAGTGEGVNSVMYSYQSAGWYGLTTNHPMLFMTNNTERARIDSSGNVGIGTSSPATKLDVNGGIIAGGENRQTHPNVGPVGFKAQWNFTGGNGETDFYNLYSVATDSFRFYQSTGNGTAQFLYDIQPSNHIWYTGGTERMRINSSGNVGIGTSSPQSKMEIRSTSGGSVVNALTLSNYVGASAGTGVALHFDPNGAGTLARAASIQSVQSASGNYADLRFFTANSDTPAERMRIGVNGGVAIGGTGTDATLHIQTSYGGFDRLTQMSPSAASKDAFNIMAAKNASSVDLWWSWGVDTSNRWRINQGVGFSTNGMAITDTGNVGMGTLSPSGKLHVETTSTGDVIFIAANTGGTAGQSVYVIPVRTAGTLRGGIQWNGTNLLYNNSSDRRLKSNIADADDAASLIDAIQVRKFDWKESGNHQRYGFIAQELIEVAPEAVHQPDDEDEMMGVDYSKLVPMLIKEVQSLRARVAQLEGK